MTAVIEPLLIGAAHRHILSCLARLSPVFDMALGAKGLGSFHPAHGVLGRVGEAHVAVGMARGVAGG
jgi:hypothetical protein